MHKPKTRFYISLRFLLLLPLLLRFRRNALRSGGVRKERKKKTGTRYHPSVRPRSSIDRQPARISTISALPRGKRKGEEKKETRSKVVASRGNFRVRLPPVELFRLNAVNLHRPRLPSTTAAAIPRELLRIFCTADRYIEERFVSVDRYRIIKKPVRTPSSYVTLDERS